MTAAPPGLTLFSILRGEEEILSRRRETFAASLIGQAGILALIIYFTTCVMEGPTLVRPILDLSRNPIFYGSNGGGGGNHDELPASTGSLPRASLDPPIVPATVIVPKETHRLMVEQSVEMAPDVRYPVSGQIGDPNSPFSQWLSNGKGGPGGIGDQGCCDGDGNSRGPYAGNGTPGLRPGRGGVSMPQAIYSPEPSFSDEARKAKVQGIVLLMVVVGKDGRPYDIHVRQSLGMGLDEKAIEAVKNWRFRPATFNGQPVATQIAVEVDFHLY
ncbi:MAG TPA: energy transducer TonB [Candidatus Dormibacteraeota bacterium]|nr:energy transducer TonB [Candidatus Dormibacteraeota bacterium]